MGTTSFRPYQAISEPRGVINVDVKVTRDSVSDLTPQNEFSPVAVLAHPLSSGLAPEAVVTHKTGAELEAEAQVLSDAANQLKTDAVSADQSTA